MTTALAPAAAAPAAPRPLRVADVTLLYGERSGGIRTYLRAKTEWARRTGVIDQRVLVPGVPARSDEVRRELPSVPCTTSNGYRLPLGARELRAAIESVAPDVVLLHDPFWAPRRITREARANGRLVVAVHHTSVALNAAGLPGAAEAWRGPLRGWYRHAYRDVDAVMSVVDTAGDSGRRPDVPLRLGVDPAFRPLLDVPRGDHVLYVGRLAREKGLVELLDAIARSGRPLHIHGAGAWESALRERVGARGLSGRVRFGPYLADRTALARTFARAACVAVPGPYETFGLVALEAAASGARVVVADTAPSARLLGTLGHPFRAGDAGDLARAIDEAVAAPRDSPAADALGARHSWDAAFAGEVADLRRLLGRGIAAGTLRAAA